MTDVEFLGATRVAGNARFRVFAPGARNVEVLIEGAASQVFALQREANGYHSGTQKDLPAGTLYKYRLDGGEPHPDPASRFQPQGPHGPSMLVEPAAFPWSDHDWRGLDLKGQVLYELHVGTFTAAGTFDAACDRLAYLKDLGVTTIEVLPIAECPGRFNWGYDGVQWYAPYHVYGDHEAFKRFIDRAHALGLAVILDVVYNHLGPDGNYLRHYSPSYFTDRYHTDWGEPLNFDGEDSHGTRTLVLDNALYWVREFHLDGLRLDATQCIYDASPKHILAELIERARAAAAPRKLLFVAENEPQLAEHLRPAQHGGYGLDAMWNDDFHHTARVALTGSRDGYFGDYLGSPQEFISVAKRGFLYQGQYYHWQKQARGSSTRGLNAASGIIFLQNHDQVGNTFTGVRCHELSSAGRFRALTAVSLLLPQTPMLFMGQEFASSRPFAFFADHQGELARLVHEGRREFLRQFRSYATPDAQARILDPALESTFRASVLDWSETQTHRAWLDLHRDLLKIRREDAVIAEQDARSFDGAVLGPHIFVLRWFDDVHGDRLLLVNLGVESVLNPSPEPLLAPPPAQRWELCWSSEHPRYGGRGAVHPCPQNASWRVEGECTVLLKAAP